MPQIEKAIPETDQLVVRPVALSIIQEILYDRMGLPSTTQVNFPGYAPSVTQPKGNISNQYEDNRFPTNTKITVEVTEQEIKDWLPSAQTKKGEHIPIFLDRDLELEMRPIYVSMELRISIVYRAANKTEARQFYDFMAMKIPNRDEMWLHDLNYSYPMPEAYMVILKEIHRLTELKAGYGEDFDAFFAKRVNPRYGLLTDQVGKNELGVFSETQSRVLGWFDFPDMPDFGSKKDETDTWEIDIPYVIRYEKPRDVYFGYPITIHNSVLGKRYRATTGMQRLQDTRQSYTRSMNHFNAFDRTRDLEKPYNDNPGRYFPLFDEFKPRHIPDKTMRIVTALVTLPDEDAADPTLLMNLSELEGEQFGFKLNESVKAFLSQEAAYLTKPRYSAFHIALYQGRHVLHDDFVTVDKDLNIRMARPLSMRHYFHIRLSVVTDFTYLLEPAKDRLRYQPDVITNILQYILPERILIPNYPVIAGRIPRGSFDQLAEWLIGRRVTGQFNTVQNTKLTAIIRNS